MRKWLDLLKGVAASILFLSAVIAIESCKSRNTSDCRPVPLYQSTGHIQCWSGGELVYSRYIYHNGGVLCSVDGKAIKITGGKSLCVIESSQDSVWNPPTSEGSK